MSAKAKYKDLVTNYLAPFLEAEGFRKGSFAFYYQHSQVLLRALTFEAGRFNLVNSYSFGMVLHFIGLTTSVDKAKTIADVVQKGNIAIMSLPMGEWLHRHPVNYTITDATDLPELANTMIEDLKTGALPVLQNTASVTDLQRLLERIEKQVGYAKFSFSMAIFLALTGDKEQSRHYFLKSGGDRAIIEKTAAAYGIDLSPGEANNG